MKCTKWPQNTTQSHDLNTTYPASNFKGEGTLHRSTARSRAQCGHSQTSLHGLPGFFSPFALREWVLMVKAQLPLANPTPQSRNLKLDWERACHSSSWSLRFHAYLCLPQESGKLSLGKDLEVLIILSQAFLLKYRLKPISLVGRPYNQEYFNLGIPVPRDLSLTPASFRGRPRAQGREETLLPASLFWTTVLQPPWRKDRAWQLRDYSLSPSVMSII